jgi:hypothetical protein
MTRLAAALGFAGIAQARPAFTEHAPVAADPKIVAWLPDHPGAVEAQLLLDQGFTHVRVAGPAKRDPWGDGPKVATTWSAPLALTVYVTMIESVPPWRD